MTTESRVPATSESGPGLEGWIAPNAAQLSSDALFIEFEWISGDLWSERECRPSPDMLRDFLALANAQPRTYAEYAHRWGALGLDEEGQPQAAGAHPQHELVEHWHGWVTEAAAMFRMGVALLRRTEVPEEARDVLKRADQRPSWPKADDESWADTRNLATHVNRWLALGAIRLEFRWPVTDEGSAWVLRSPHLFGALALALAGVLTSSIDRATSPDLALCSDCGLPYYATRQPAAGRLHFCPDCGVRASWRHAKRRQRARQGPTDD